jgi:hypothetical protein
MLHVAIAGGSEISSDYPGVLSRALAAVKGDQMLTLFTSGMSGKQQPRRHKRSTTIKFTGGVYASGHHTRR